MVSQRLQFFQSYHMIRFRGVIKTEKAAALPNISDTLTLSKSAATYRASSLKFWASKTDTLYMAPRMKLETDGLVSIHGNPYVAVV